jgi:hypothetical protein
MPTALYYLLAVMVPCIAVMIWLIITIQTTKTGDRLAGWAQSKDLVIRDTRRLWLWCEPFGSILEGDVVVEFQAESSDGTLRRGCARTRSLFPPFTSRSFEVSFDQSAHPVPVSHASQPPSSDTSH